MKIACRAGLRALVAFSLLAFSACNLSSSTTGQGYAPLRGNGVKTEGSDFGQIAFEIEGKAAGVGTPIQLSKYKGKVVLLDFWATWCQPCVRAIPHEKQLVTRFAGRPFALIGISIDHTQDALVSFIGKNALSWPNIFDEDGKISAKWDIGSVPTFILINAQGDIVGRWEGARDLPTIDKSIEYELELLEKKK